MITVYLLLAFILTGRLWWNLPTGYLPVSDADNYQFEWFLWHGPHAVLNGLNPLFTDLMNWPEGANLMGNASVLGLGLPLAPITLLFGPQVTFAVCLTLSFAGTAAAWYWLFDKLVPGSTVGCAIGGAFVAFAPPIVSHGNGAHLNLIANFVIPFIVWHALQLRFRDKAVRSGIILGLLIVYQFFIGEEILLQTAFGIGLFGVVYALLRPREAWAAVPGMLRGVPFAVGIPAALLWYPLWFQFEGPQAYDGIPHGTAPGNDILGLGMSASQSLFGDKESVLPYILNHTEENAFFGWLLLAWLTAMIVWLWRDVRVKVAAFMIVAAFALSLGNKARFDERGIFNGPWRLLHDLPLFDSIHPSRMTFIALPFIGLIFALTGKRVKELLKQRSWRDRTVLAVVLSGALALLPAVPKPLPVDDRPATPEFLTSGAWKQVIQPGDIVLTVPMTHLVGDRSTMTWQFPTDGEFRIAGGYFVMPWSNERRGQYSTRLTSTQVLLGKVWDSGEVPQIGHHELVYAKKDLTALGVDVVLVTPQKHENAVVTTVTKLLGNQPQHIADSYVWRVTP